MKIPDGYLWENPGFPSIFVSYHKTNDFFFSSFLGVTLIFALEFEKMDQIILFIISLVVLFFQTLLVIFLRGNYFIDIFAAILFAHYAHMMSNDLANYLDEKNILTFEENKNEKREKITL